MYRRRSRLGEERRKAFLIAVLKLALAASAFGLTSYYSYEVGLRVAQGETATLKDKLEEATQEARKQQEQAVGDRAALNEARKQADDFKALYEQVKPSDDIKELSVLLRAKLA